MNNDPTPRRIAAGIAIGMIASTFCVSVQAQDTPAADTWHYAVGATALTQPRYPGSDRRKTRLLPIAAAAYGRFSLGELDGTGIPVGASVDLLEDPHWKVGVALGSDIGKPRKASDSPRLAGLGDIDATLLGSLYARFDDSWLEIRGNVTTDVGNRRNGIRELSTPAPRRATSQGTQASIDIEGKYSPTPGLTVVAGPGLVWADRRHERAFFGVDDAQSVDSGLATYSPRAGIDAARMTLGADYRLTRQWHVSATLIASDLLGDAAGSPVTDKRWQTTAALAATLRF